MSNRLAGTDPCPTDGSTGGGPSLLIETIKLELFRPDDPGRRRCRCMKAKEFDGKFEKGGNVIS